MSKSIKIQYYKYQQFVKYSKLKSEIFYIEYIDEQLWFGISMNLIRI